LLMHLLQSKGITNYHQYQEKSNMIKKIYQWQCGTISLIDLKLKL
jgi:hypothetical protein